MYASNILTSLEDAALLSPVDAAKLLSIPVQTLAVWRHNRRIDLPWVKVGRLVRYRLADLKRFISESSRGVAA
jgi:excisionase family DNA binding protein